MRTSNHRAWTSDRLLAPLMIVVGTVGACAPTDTSGGESVAANDVARATEALWMYPDTQLWPSGHISVCLQPYFNGDMPGTAEWDEAVNFARTAIEDAYETVPFAGIDFSGWQLCDGWEDYTIPDVPTGMLRLAINTNPAGEAAHFFNCPPGHEFGPGTDELAPCSGPLGYVPTREPIVYWARHRAGPVTALLHEVGHALGFAHEFDRVHDGGCAPPGEVESADFFTNYDGESILAGTYCNFYPGKLSIGDKLGLSIAYPTSFTRTIHGRHGFATAGGLLVRSDDSLVTEWTHRGAPGTVFDTPISWNLGSAVFSTPVELAVSNLPGEASIAGSYDDLRGRRHTLEPTAVRTNNGLHTALVVAVM
jgi:hypothetical protein